MTPFLDDTRGAALLQALTTTLGGQVSRMVAPDVYVAGGSHLLLQAEDSPAPGVTTWASAGLSEISWEDHGFPHRIEVFVAGASAWPELARAAAVLVSHVRAQHWLPAPGRVLRQAVALAQVADVGERLPHLYLECPFPWDESAWVLGVGQEPSAFTVVPTFAFAISEAEAAYREEHGAEAFSDLMASARLPIFDLDRPSVV